MNDITDWRINLDSGAAVAFPGGREPSGEQKAVGDQLVAWMRDNAHGRFQFSFPLGGFRYRAQNINGPVYALRRITPIDQLSQLRDLGFHSAITRELMSERLLDGGMVLVSGPTGSGKTTTVVASLRERLKEYGGYCLAIEDPIEYELAGFHGESGYCDQIEAADTEDYENRVIQAMRCFPAKTKGTLYLGEVRDSITASEAAKVSLSGFQVWTTLHAFGIISTVHRMLVMMGGEDSSHARATLGDSLRLIVHQKWDEGRNRIAAEMLPVTDRVRAAIKNGKLDALKDDLYQVQQQMRGR